MGDQYTNILASALPHVEEEIRETIELLTSSQDETPAWLSRSALFHSPTTAPTSLYSRPEIQILPSNHKVETVVNDGEVFSIPYRAPKPPLYLACHEACISMVCRVIECRSRAPTVQARLLCHVYDILKARVRNSSGGVPVSVARAFINTGYYGACLFMESEGWAASEGDADDVRIEV